MPSEASIKVSLNISSSEYHLDYRSTPTAFNADVPVGKGPTPGLVVVTTEGGEVDLSLLTQPGLAWLANLDDTNYIEYGTWDPNTEEFTVLGEILPGECYVIRFSRNLLEAYLNTGTGTTGMEKKFWMRANGGTVNARVDAFEGADV